MSKLQVIPTFVKTRNVRNFEVMMDGLGLSAGEGRLAVVEGRAGRGKTRTSQWYAANNGCVYLRVATVWRTSELEFLRALCRELGIRQPPHRKGPCFTDIVDILMGDPRPVFIDELEKLPPYFLDLIRDISDMSAAPFVMIGEEEVVPYMRRNRRVWSRTFQHLHFDPINAGDIIFYFSESCGVKIDPAVAAIFHGSSGGDFRIVRRDMLNLVHLANAKGTSEITGAMAKMAVKTGLSGR